MGKSKFQISRSLDEKIRRIISGSSEAESEFSLVSSAYILGFNYGNVTNCVGLTTNYRLHHAVFPVVGFAFFKKSPTDDEIKANLKLVKEYSSSPNGLGSFKSDKNEHLFLIYSVDEQTKEVDKRIFNFSKGSFVRRKRHRLHILNDPYCPKEVYCGSDDVFNVGDEDSMSSADEDQVDHLIFFIHGVGGVCDVRFRSCVEVVADFKKMANILLVQHSNPSSGVSTPSTNRHLASSLKKGFFRKHSNESTTSRASEASDMTRSTPSSKVRAKRVECLPISWHSLTRRQTGFSEQLNLVALSSAPKLRHFLNKVVMDAMLYSSGPVYTQTIMNNVGNEINRLYTLFMERHPNFTGSISLAGHSLGSVIVFDLLAHQIPDDIYTSSSEQSASNNNENDSNHNIKEEAPTRPRMNTRQNCYNISHDHHDVSSNDLRYCSDYTNLQELLNDMDIAQYAEVFHREHIDLKSLLFLTDLDMKELRLPLGARRKLGTYINFKRVSANSDDKMKTTTNISNPFGNMNTGQCLINYPQLKFKPRCFFSFGSPTAMFLNVRGIQELGASYKLPTCDKMLNIYHPYDPLAYRFEPLIDPRFKNVEPVLIPHHRGGKRMHVQLREGFARVGFDLKHRLLDTIKDTWSSFTGLSNANDTPELSRSSSVVEDTGEGADRTTSSLNVLSQQSADGDLEFDQTRIGKLNGGRRIDYVLQEKPIELFNEYIFAFTSHANYWLNEDSALIILNEIYQVDGINLSDQLE